MVSVGAVHNNLTVSVVGFEGSNKGGGCHEATDHSCGNGCVLSVDSLHVLTKDSVVTGAQMCQYSSCLPWQCLFGCSNGRHRPLSCFDELLSMAVVTASWWTLLIAVM